MHWSAATAQSRIRRSSTTSGGRPALFFQAVEHLLGPRDLGGILLVPDRRCGPAVAGLEQGQVTQHLAWAEGDVGPQRLGQLPAGPGASLAEQGREPVGDGLSALLVGRRPRALRLQGGDATLAKALEGGAGGMWMTAEMAGNAWRRPAGVGEQDHVEAVAGGVGQVGMAQTAKFAARGAVELDL